MYSEHDIDPRLLEKIWALTLKEVLEEEAVDVLEEAIFEIDTPNYESTSLDEKQLNDISEQLTRSLFNEVFQEELTKISTEFFDGIIASHHVTVEAVRYLNFLIEDVTVELVEDIALSILNKRNSSKSLKSFVEDIVLEVIEEEYTTVAQEVVNHYSARVALVQYKQIKASASNQILDSIILESLLSQFKSEDNDESPLTRVEQEESGWILDKIMYDIVLAQSLALHSCFPEHDTKVFGKPGTVSKLSSSACVPLKWYKKKLTVSIGQELILSMLSNRLDNAMQNETEDHLKNKAVDLSARFLSTT